jgi:hypothetical protein
VGRAPSPAMFAHGALDIRVSARELLNGRGRKADKLGIRRNPRIGVHHRDTETQKKRAQFRAVEIGKQVGAFRASLPRFENVLLKV